MSTTPKPSLLDRATATFQATQLEEQWRKDDAQERMDQANYELGLAHLSRLIPQILEVDFAANAAERSPVFIDRIKPSHFTACVTIEGYCFRPLTLIPGTKSQQVQPHEIDGLEVLVRCTWKAQGGYEWLPVYTLNDLGAALHAEKTGSLEAFPWTRRQYSDGYYG
ncbi:hypothetical protein Dxin01_00814 [Deinococcus xinjiangensis]|uniref:Uncharacterized protein n=1 Tax=Deinococcus xinjiangensis TaxID=457454 RepID=A0ABP9VCQ0_9DEIO